MEVSEHLDAEQLFHRGFFQSIQMGGKSVKVPGQVYGLLTNTNPGDLHDPVEEPKVSHCMPLAGVRVLDFSWVIAGPTTTRYMAAMGAEVIKVEAPGKGDPARRTGLHAVLGQGKRGIVLNLKSTEGAETARALAAKCDIVIENFGTGGIGITRFLELD